MKQSNPTPDEYAIAKAFGVQNYVVNRDKSHIIFVCDHFVSQCHSPRIVVGFNVRNYASPALSYRDGSLAFVAVGRGMYRRAIQEVFLHPTHPPRAGNPENLSILKKGMDNLTQSQVDGPLIFLDIDGVMNDGRRAIHDEPVAFLAEIVRATGARIVISSSWRHTFSLEEIKAMMVAKGLPENVQFIGGTPDLCSQKPGQAIIEAQSRWSEIQHYLQDHPETPFCILDDSCDGLPPRERYVETRFNTGLRREDAERAIQILRQARQS